MLSRLMPREGGFFELFNAHAAGIAWYLGRMLLS